MSAENQMAEYPVFDGQVSSRMNYIDGYDPSLPVSCRNWSRKLTKRPRLENPASAGFSTFNTAHVEHIQACTVTEDLTEINIDKQKQE